MGVLFSVLAGLFLGLFQALNGRARREVAIAHGTLILLLVSTTVVAGGFFLSAGVASFSQLSLRSTLLFGAAGLLHFIGGWTLLSASQTLVGAGRTGILVGATPILAAVMGYLFLGETLEPIPLFGILVVVAGVVVVSYDKLPEEER